jgi:uncharacterized membrane protein
MKYWATSIGFLVLGLAGAIIAWQFFGLSLWLLVPSAFLILLGLMPLSAAREHMRQQLWAQRSPGKENSGKGRGDAA